MKLVKNSLSIGTAILLMMSCASYRELPKDYSVIAQKNSKSGSDRTVIFFLVDGLPVKMLKQELVAGRAPQINSFFIGSKHEMYIARTGFPSLTFSGIGSLLTERPVDQNGLFGNRVMSVRENEILNLEQPNNYIEVARRIKNRNIFSRLKEKGQKTVSFSYIFYADADVHSDILDPQAGLALLNQDYQFLDRKTLDSLHLLLSQTKPEAWPEFIFVHLVGIDFLSHERGPQSPIVANYLNKLDLELKPIFEILNSADLKKQRKVLAMLSSDHGFDQTISERVDPNQLLGALPSEVRVLNEGRFIGLYFPKTWTAPQRDEYLQRISAQSYIEITAQRQDNRVAITSLRVDTQFIYSKAHCQDGEFAISIQQSRPRSLKDVIHPAACPEKLDASVNYLYHPYFLSNLSHYFQAEAHPDAVILPRPGVSFAKGTLGQHGGPTADEIFVPLLIHNGTLTDFQRNPSLWQLLQFM